MKAVDEMSHSNLHPAHAVRPRFIERILIRPLIASDTVAGNHGPGSVRTAAAMDEHGAIGA